MCFFSINIQNFNLKGKIKIFEFVLIIRFLNSIICKLNNTNKLLHSSDIKAITDEELFQYVFEFLKIFYKLNLKIN